MIAATFRIVAGAFVALVLFGALHVAAQLHFDRQALSIETASGAKHTFTVELALDSAQRQQGLMLRRDMAPDAGMLFDFDEMREVSMWMRNTLIPLDMLFIDDKGKVTHIHENAEPLSEAIISSEGPVKFVLELKGGEVGKRKIKAGDRVVSPQIGKRR